MKGTLGEKEPEEIVAAYGPKGVIYEKFSLILPKRSIVSRPEVNKIEIETEKLKISMTVRFEGFSTAIPWMFKQYYLGISNPLDITVYELNVDIQVSMKLRALFSSAGWGYYHWIDSFLDNIEENVSKEAFFDRINWEGVSTVLQCFNRKRAKRSSKHK